MSGVLQGNMLGCDPLPRGWCVAQRCDAARRAVVQCMAGRGRVLRRSTGCCSIMPVSYTHLRAHETSAHL
eukprot:12711092-Alexandrium_andersonii.AAC.1